MWSLRPRQLRPSEIRRLPPIKKTHHREFPLPIYVFIMLDAPTPYEGYYAGHGKSKMAYRLCTYTQDPWKTRTVLKLRPEYDTEPILFYSLPNEVCPTVYDHRECLVYRNSDANSAEQPEIWNAWTTDMVRPCDQVLEADGINLEVLVWHTLLCMCLSANYGLLISDNGLPNFGVLNGRVLLIDAGSRQIEKSPLEKSRLTNRIK